MFYKSNNASIVTMLLPFSYPEIRTCVAIQLPNTAINNKAKKVLNASTATKL